MASLEHLPEVGPAVPSARGTSTESAAPSNPTRLRQLGHDVRVGERYALGAAVGLWMGDALLLALTRAGATWSQWWQGVGAAAIVATSTAVALGAVAGPILAPPLRQLSRALGSQATALRSGHRDARHAFLARLLALGMLVVCWCVATYETTIAALFGFARPGSMAVATTLSELALTAVLLAAWPWVVRAWRAGVDAAAKTPGLRFGVAHAWPVPAVIVALLLGAAAFVAVLERSELRSLPWYLAVPAGGLVVGLLGAAWLSRWPRALSDAVVIVTAFLVAAAGAAGTRVHRESSTAQHLAFDRALSGQVGYAAWRSVLDFDRDGQINVLGGGDCAPLDPTRYTGAPDIPGNGIDEDCDGADQSPQSFFPRRGPTLKAGVIPPKSTVLLVTVDALAAPELAALGGSERNMPHVDELATRSMLFAHCFAQGPSTRMSFPSIFTSRWDSQQTFEYSPRLPYSFADTERTLQDAFDEAGYQTVAVVPNVYFDPSRWASVTRGFQRVDTSALKAPKHNAVEVTDAALRVLSEPRDRPLYLWVHYFDAHPPYGSPPGVVSPDHDDRTLYSEELRSIDDQLGRLIDAVDHRADPTYLVFSADHATSFHPVPESRHFHYGYDIYTSTLHVPLLFHGPGLRVGRDDDVVSTMDIAPTLANLFSLSDHGRFEGSSLVWELTEGVNNPKRFTLHEYYLPEKVFRGTGDPLEFVAIRTDRYNLIENRTHGTYELYDWTADYYEQHDLYEERARAPDVAYMRSLLGAFVQKYGQSGANPTPRPASERPWSPPGQSIRAVEP